MQEHRTAGLAADVDGQETPVMHACGHDMHVAWLAAAATLLARTTGHWQGTRLRMQKPKPPVHRVRGGTDADTYRKSERAGTLNELPTNHNPHFAPVMHPTLETGIETLVTAACAWLAPRTDDRA
jgi:metal-dependent amidase/aminoacylase/carboxypeptidase family protein